MKLLEETNISLEVILLLVMGIVMLVLGCVLFLIAEGVLPYYEEGVVGLLLIIGSLQMQTTGKTQLGFLRRSWPVIITGFIIAMIGFVTCFVPGILGDFPKFLVVIFLGAGGILLLFQMVLSKDLYPLWKTLVDRVYTELYVSSGAVYILEILIALMIALQMFWQVFFIPELWVIIFLAFGISLFYLAVTLHKIYQIHPESDISTTTPGIPLDLVMGMQFAVFMVVVGSLLFLVSLGLLPFAPSAQIGTMIVLLGVQALIVGNMMTFGFKRNWILLFIGLMFVAVGAFAVIVPDTILIFLSIFLGVFNILGGLYLFYILFGPKSESERPVQKPNGKDGLLLISNFGLAILNVILMIIFGVATLIQNLIPVIIIGITLASWGLSQFVMLYIQELAKKKHLL
jgi:hypothetical protein